jgi:Cu+-exporting ATPase
MALLVKDPVCGMDVDPTTAAGKSDHDGLTYYFCSDACKQAFDAEPHKFVPLTTEPLPPSEGARAKRWWEFWK